ncbi:chromate efflux transporter [Thermosynechococcaceae cyanobacterium BACA0444]|uniref:Chromate efflux transporter n=1 Tax=Pseudocalidococcus azoricus BACA0444 TaxID=2918990 RepID=A0AAE4FR51_9CYAN|nr:chromate efflux transporter [Pseudocalidococcus azoricus]MDS3859727.1 chromate efflux transporter [Pseudocalidococcus azoricus BACA0444]
MSPSQEIPPPPRPYQDLSPPEQRQRLQELALVFLKLGTFAFGGPAAHLAMMDEEVVGRRQWLTREKLLDLIGITNLIPGPNSTELAIYIGAERAGWRGLIVAGCCFILPAMLIVWGLAALYVQTAQVPQVEWLLYGIKPVIIAIVLQALWKLGRKAIKDNVTLVAAGAAVGAYFLGWSEVLALAVLGLGVMLIKAWQGGNQITPGLVGLPMGVSAQVTTATPELPVGWVNVFLIFLKIGLVLYGGGYVLLAFVQREFVEQTHWLTSQQLLDAVAIGQVTPGPLFTTATFIGYLLAGNSGAVAGTVGIFLPSFLLVALINPWVNHLRRSAWVAGALDGVNAAALGLMAGVMVTLTQAAVVDAVTIGVAVVSGIILFKWKVNSAWLILAGGLVGFLTQDIGTTG